MQLIDSTEIDTYLAGFFPDNPKGAELLQIAIARALRKRPENMEKVGSLPENAPVWLCNKWPEGGPYYRFKPDAGLNDEVRHIADWIGAALQDNDDWLRDVDEQKRPKKLLKIGSLEVATNEADKAMALKNQKLALTLGADAGNAAVVEKFDDGYVMVQLSTPQELDYESVKTGHCIGQGEYDDQLRSGSHVYYSLRDRFNKPHATLEVEKASNALLQCKGAQNQPPVAKYMPFIQQFVKAKHYKLTEDASHTGLIEQDGEYYDINNLPTGLKWRGNLDLLGCTSLTHLPDNLSVGGSLILASCTSLPHLPENLSVGHDLDLNGCTSLTHLGNHTSVGNNLYLSNCTSLPHLPENLSVGGDLYLNDCTSLPHLPDNLSVGGSLTLASCTSLPHLPENLSVGRDLYLYQCDSLTHLPENLSVGRDLNLYQCDSLTHLPDNLSVGGNLYLNDCPSLTHLPENLSVGGRLYLSRCTSLTHLPENLSVGGYLSLENCPSLKNLPKGLKVKGDLDVAGTNITEIPEDAQIGGKVIGLEENRQRLGWKPDQKPSTIQTIVDAGPQRRGRNRGDD